MDNKANKKRRRSTQNMQLKAAQEWFKKYSFTIACGLLFVGSFGILYGVYEVIRYFGIDMLTVLAQPWVIFICFSFVLTAARIIYHLLNGDSKITITSDGEISDDFDSLIAMMKDAEQHFRWKEIIMIGHALSEVLWFTSKRKLRFTIGKFVETAAKNLNDQRTLAFTYVEDLGNTALNLGWTEKAEQYLKKGISIALTIDEYYILARGYRNLAAYYAYKNMIKEAHDQLELAITACSNITDERERLDAQGAIYYLKCKTFAKEKNYDAAICELENALKIYGELSTKFPDTQAHNSDRTVKIYREKGSIYLQMNDEIKLDEAATACNNGLDLAINNSNHDEIIRCCTLLAEINIREKDFEQAETFVKIAEGELKYIDTPAIKKDFNSVKARLEVERKTNEA